MESSKRTRYKLSHSRVCLIFLGLAALFYSPLLLGLRTFPDGDFTHHFLPFSLFQQQELFSGRWPLWNPYTYSGHPFLADTQAAVFYPINLMVMLIAYPLEALFTSKAAGRLYFLQVEAALHIALAGFFTYLFVQKVTHHSMAGLLAGITFAFSGYLIGYPPLQFAVLRTAIWLPLILFILWQFIDQSGDYRWWIGLVFAVSSAFLAGHPQTMLHIAYVAAAWVIFLLVQQWRRDEHRRALRAVAALALSVVAIVGLCAIQLFPSLEFMQLSVRAETSYEFVSAGFPLRDTWQLILPGVFTWFSPIYIGIAGLGLVVCAVGLLGRHIDSDNHLQEVDTSKIRGIVLFWMSITVVALLIAYGRNGFLYPVVYRLLPGWDLFRQQERAAYIVTLGLSILAGFGYMTLTLIPIKRRRLLAIIYAVLVLASVYSFGLLWQVAGDSVISNLAYIGIATGTLLIVALFGIALWWEDWDDRRAQLIILMVVLNLFFANFTTNVSQFGPARKTILSPELQALEAAIDESSPNQHSGRVYNEFRVYEDYGMRQSIEDVWGSSPLKLAHYAKLFDEFPLDRMWRLTGVDHVLTWRRELFEPSALLEEFPQTGDTTFLHRLSEPNPRAWVVPDVFYATDDAIDQVADLLGEHGFDLETGAIIMQAEPPQPQIGQGSGIGLTQSQPIDAQINLNRAQPGLIQINALSDAGGFLVVSETYMPGWQIENLLCNGNSAACSDVGPSGIFPPLFEIQRANLTLIGLAIPPGEVSFDLVYRPQSFRRGAWISGLTAILLLIGGIGLRFRKPGKSS